MALCATSKLWIQKRFVTSFLKYRELTSWLSFRYSRLEHFDPFLTYVYREIEQNWILEVEIDFIYIYFVGRLRRDGSCSQGGLRREKKIRVSEMYLHCFQGIPQHSFCLCHYRFHSYSCVVSFAILFSLKVMRSTAHGT